MNKISFSQVLRSLQNIKLPACELVVGIAQGGVVPASLVAAKLGCKLCLVKFNYRNEDNIPQHPEPVLLSSFTSPKDMDRILLVDDVAISGKTLQAAKRLFHNHQVTTMVLRGQADYVLFPKLRSCVKWPWKV